MRATSAAALVLAAVCVVPSPLPAKGDIVKVTIQGPDLATPAEIRPNIGEFNVWFGPGVGGFRAEQTSRYNPFLIDWSKGVVPPPLAAVLQHYEVSFYSGCRKYGNCRPGEPTLVYAVSWAYDPSTKEGFIYLPGRNDEWYALNTRTILRGVEGNWFRSTAEWEKFARPRLVRARAVSTPEER